MERRPLLEEGSLNASDPPKDDEQVSCRFGLGLATVVLVLLHNGYFGGFTSPVVSTNCGDGDGGSEASGSAGGDPAPCPGCMNCELNLSVQVISIFTSEVSLLTIPASLLGGGLTDYLGRKKTLILTSIGLVMGWLVIYAVPAPHAGEDMAPPGPGAALWPQVSTATAMMLLGGRAIIAVSACIQIIAGSVWISESCPAAIRGAAMTCISFGWNAGNVGIYALGAELAWRDLSAGGALIGAVCVAMSCFHVESPRWLAANVGMPAAEQALKTLRQGEDPRVESTLAYFTFKRPLFLPRFEPTTGVCLGHLG